ncbi:MAG: hypothetical protein PUG67_08150 [Peptoniphilaceae bacterium]|nr:hypothetical protein [Peptoniphilaceae bacterium]MDY6019767.1 hypothetical protein [Anaerococcus sp.]
MKQREKFQQIKIILALIALLLSFPYVNGKLNLVLFFLVALIFIVMTILYAVKEALDTVSSVVKFILCFLNISSLIYFVEEFTKVDYFKTVTKNIYGPLFEKGINTNIFLLFIFVVTSILIFVFNRLNVGE